MPIAANCQQLLTRVRTKLVVCSCALQMLSHVTSAALGIICRPVLRDLLCDRSAHRAQPEMQNRSLQHGHPAGAACDAKLPAEAARANQQSSAKGSVLLIPYGDERRPLLSHSS